MTLIQKQAYLLKLFESDAVKMTKNYEEKQKIEKHVESEVKPFLPIPTYSDPLQADRIVFLHTRIEMLSLLKRELPHAPEVAPTEIKNFLLENHSNPPVWFLGQLIKYAWKENENTTNETNKIVSRVPFECGPVVGIHVRLTDKSRETKLNQLDEYMKWVEFWFNVMGEPQDFDQIETLISNCTNRRKLFIATDEPRHVLKEANDKWGNKYEIYHGKQDGKYGNNQDDPNRISKEALIELLAEINILAKCQFVVCAFSSNHPLFMLKLFVFKLLSSLDNEMEATAEYRPTSEYPLTPEEIYAAKGDIIEVKSPIQNGFIRGKNLMTNIEGRFPMYLLKEHFKFENFSAFVNIQ
uniref:SH3 domain-containing protein n=1 Tax=Meloidogyne hapla TaxID=6305 RepID=A0A1I8AZ75_MELHA